MDVSVQIEVDQASVDRVTDGNSKSLRGVRDGSLVEIPWRQAVALEGRIFVVNYGQGTTLVTGHNAAPTQGQPDANLDIPQGVSIIVMEFWLNAVTAAGTANHFWLQMGQGLTGNATSSAATAGPLNLRGDFINATRCTARQAYSATGTAPLFPMEVWSTSINSAATTTTPVISAPKISEELLPVLIGPASLSFFSTSTTTAATFKAILKYIELPSAAIV